MTSFMNILVSVRSERAMARIAALQGGMTSLQRGVVGVNSQTPLGQRHISSLMKFGNQLQWTGRMLQYNFTLPLLLAGGAAMKFSLDQEKAFKHVEKVYGDVDAAAAQFQKQQKSLTDEMARNKAAAVFAAELEALDDAFTAISNHYGVQKTQVNEVAGAWAAAGASGLDLAKSVNATMKAIIIGDMDATTATKALISIQAQYNLNTQELMATLADLNSVENQTGASMADLITGFEKAAGVARSAGIETDQLAAYIAALVPASGTAATAGNALKTMISRLMAPTKEAKQVMEAMGLEVTAMSWQSATAAERLEIMSREFNGLGASAQGAAASVIASRWQVNRFEILMRELGNSMGYYQKALDSVEDQGESFRRMQKELNTVLESNPRALQRMMVMLQNASVEIIQPLIPFILYLADSVADLATSFAGMNPYLQKTILLGLVMLAFVGPLVRYMGALATLYGVFGVAVLRTGKFLGFFSRTMVTSTGAIVVARKGVLQFLQSLLMLNVIRKVGTVVMGAFGLIGSGVSALVVSTAGAVAGIGSVVIANAATIGSALISLWGRIFVGMAIVQTGGLGAVVKSWIASLAFMLKGFSAFGKATMLIQSAMTAASVLFSRQFFIPMLFGLGNFANIFTAAWATLWGWVRYYMTSVQLAMLGAWTTFRVTFLAGWAGVHVGMVALGQWFSKAWLALQTAMYRAWLAVTAAGNAGIAALERAWATTRLALGRAFSAAYVALQGAMWKAIALVWAAGSRGVTLIMALFSKNMLKLLGRFALATVAALTGPWGIAAAVVVGILYAFRSQIAQIWNNILAYFSQSGISLSGMFQNMSNAILRAFYSLPQGVQKTMVAIVTVVRDAALAVYDWFSYINPWAHHSPSLVENVTSGVARIASEFAKVPSKTRGPLQQAYAEIKRFGQLTANINVNAAAQERKEDRKTIRKAGGSGAALASYDRLAKILDRLEKKYAKLEQRMKAQQAVVDRWQNKLDQANRRLEKQQDVLDRLQKKLDKYQDKLDDANDRLAYFSSAPLKGMQEMEDQIFANQMAQTRLRYEMMQFEDVHGTFDELTKKMEQAAGAQELLRGTQADLRAAGAGSEILGVYDQEIGKLEEQKDKYAESATALANMQAQLDKLQREAERLDLVKAMKFDELQYQIDKAANRMKELTFDEIMAGIKEAQKDIDKYTEKVDEATQAVEQQQQVVDQLIDQRDAIQDRLDQEQAALDAITERYNAIGEAISAVSDAMSNVVSNAQALIDALEEAKKKKDDLKGSDPYISPGLQNFLDAGNADFPDPGGSGLPPRSDWESQAADIEAWTERLAGNTTKMFESLNPFGPLKEKALAAWNWIRDKAENVADKVGDFFSSAFDNVSFGGGGGALDKVKEFLEPVAEFITKVFKDIAKVFKWAWALLGPEVIQIGEGIWEGLKSIWESVGPELAKFGDLIKPMGKAIQNLWTVIKPVLGLITGAFLAVAKVVLSVVADTIQPAFEAIGEILGRVIQFFRGFIELVVGILTGDWKLAWEGAKDIVKGAFGAIWEIIEGAGEIIWGIVKGIVTGIYDFFVWLWDVLVGHSIVPDIINGIIDTFELLVDLADWVWDEVLNPIYEFFVSLWEDKLKPFLKTWFDLVTGAWNLLTTVATWVWNKVLNPVFTKIKEIWDLHIKGELQAWRSRFEAAWNLLTAVATWVWNKVLNPVFTKVKEIWDLHIKGELRAWRGRFEKAWELLAAVATWVWDNVLSPVFTKVKEIWDLHIKGELRSWRGKIERAWNKLKDLGTWITDEVMTPVKEAFANGWTAVKDWFTNHANMLTKPAKTIVSAVVDAVNILIKGLNKVSDILPGFDWEIPPIEFAKGGALPKYAEGTAEMMRRRVGGGFKTNGARAIVGEGKANHPEFVIPTDPTYRTRAKGLLAMAASKLGVSALGVDKNTLKAATHTNPAGNVPEFGIGGWLGDRWNDAQGLADDIAGLSRNAIGTIMDPAFDAGRAVISKADWEIPRELGLGFTNQLQAWVKDSDQNLNQAIDQYTIPVGGNVPVPLPDNPGGRSYWKGGTFSNKFIAHMKKAEQLAGQSIGVMQGGFRPATSYSGTSHQGDAVDLQPSSALIVALRRVGIAAGDRTGLGDWAPHAHAIPGPGAGYAAGSAVWQWQDYIARGGMSQSLSSPWGLAEGGIVKARRGGVWANLSEGGNDEAVIPLPRSWKSTTPPWGTGSDGGDTFIFNGDLSFPNITDPNDAETFIANLKSLAGGDK